MKSIEQILELAAPLSVGFAIRIENPPWHDLVIADTRHRGPNGSPVISVFHSGKQGEIAFPQMSFEIERFGTDLKLNPLNLRRKATSDVEHCIVSSFDNWIVVPALVRAHSDFARAWDEVLIENGYIETFQNMQPKNQPKVKPTIDVEGLLPSPTSGPITS